MMSLITPNPTPYFEYDVFIVYAAGDFKLARELYYGLGTHLRVYYDQNVLPGGRRAKSALEKSQHLVIALSPRTFRSDDCVRDYEYFEKLTKLATSERRVYIAIIQPIETADFPFNLEDYPYVDLTKKFDTNLKKLMQAIHNPNTGESLSSFYKTYRPPDAPHSFFIADGRLISTSDAGLFRASPIVGRDEIIQQGLSSLAKRRHVLLYGNTGAGKTALAAEITAQWLQTQKSGTQALWLQVGSADEIVILDAIIRAVQPQSNLQIPDNQTQRRWLVWGLLKTGVKLIVLDDSWNSLALRRILAILPSQVVVLITAQYRLYLDSRKTEIQVPDLQAHQSAQLLMHYAKKPLLAASASIAELSTLLDHIPLIVGIAGKILASTDLSPNKLRVMIAENRHIFTMNNYTLKPEIRRLKEVGVIETLLSMLDISTRQIFFAFGAFSAPILTLDLLSMYLRAHFRRLQGSEANTQHPEGHLAYINPRSITVIKGFSAEDIQQALNRLTDFGLVTYLPATSTRVAAYQLHQAGYGVAKSHVLDANHATMVQVCLNYLKRYRSDQKLEYQAMVPILNVMMGAVEWTFRQARWDQTETMVWELMHSNLFDYYSYGYHLIPALEYGLAAAQKLHSATDRN